MGIFKLVHKRRTPETAAEMYEVRPEYQRFNQKYNMTRQLLWDGRARELHQRMRASLNRLVQERKPGYSPLDLAYYRGSVGNLMNTGFSINWPNQRGNRWQPLGSSSAPSRLATSEGSDPGPTLGDGEVGGDVISPRSIFGDQRWQGLPAEAARVVGQVAKLFGADLVGFCRLDRRWAYSHYYDERTGRDYPLKFSDEPGYEGYDQPTQLEDGPQVIPKEMKYVVVLIHEMDEEGMATAPTLTQMATTLYTYSQISFTTVMVAEFIRGLGYNAIPSANCTALSIPLAIDAGLGQLGRNAKLITPRFGPRCRISKVITDLPLPPGRPMDFGVTEFCNACKKCARKCPAGAIPLGDRSFEPVNECNNWGALQWQVDHKRCFEYWSRVGTNCGICIRVCPFNKGKNKIHSVTRWFIKHTRWLDPVIVRLDDAVGYGRYKNPSKFLWRQDSEGEPNGQPG